MNAQLTTRLRTLRLSGMVEALPARVAQADAAPLAHLEFLELLVDDELSRRADRLFARRLKQAGIVTVKTLAEFDWAFNPKLPKSKLVELASGRFVQTHSGVLLIGPPGVGKSHMATAIAVGAIRAGQRALVRSTFDLVADFAEAAHHRLQHVRIASPTSPKPMPRARDVIWCNSSRASISSYSRTSA